MRAFLLEFDRERETLTLSPFDDREQALHALGEREGRRSPQVEVVLLYAESEAELKKTHARYFEEFGQIVSLAPAGWAGDAVMD